MVSQEEVLQLVRENPDLSAAELTDLHDWGDLTKYDNYMARISYRAGVATRLYRLSRFGLVKKSYVNGKPIWRAVE